MAGQSDAAERLSGRAMQSRAVRGAAYVLLGNLPGQILAAVSTLLAGRILAPAAFGALSLAQTIFGISSIVTSSGLTTYLLRNPQASDRTINIVWTASVVRGLVLSAVLWIVALPITSVFGGGEVERELLRVLALGHLVVGFANLHTLRFAHGLKFGMMAGLDSIGVVTSHLVSIGFLWHWRTPMAYAVGITVGRAAATLATWIVTRRWPHPAFDKSELIEVWRFSRFITANGIITYALYNCDNLIVSKLGGPTALGIYAMAFQLSNTATLFLISPLWKVLLPIFGRLQGNTRIFAKTVEASISVFAACAWTVAATAWTFAPDLFLLLSPDGKWNDAVPIFRAFSAFTIIRATVQPLGQMIVARGRPAYLTGVGAVQLALLIPGVSLGYWGFGLLGASFTVTALGVFVLGALLFIAPRLAPVSRLRVLGYLLIPAPIGMGCAWLGWLAASWTAHTITRLVCGSVTSGVLFVAAWELLCATRAGKAFGCLSLLGVARNALTVDPKDSSGSPRR